jgi:hypothetical protein
LVKYFFAFTVSCAWSLLAGIEVYLTENLADEHEVDRGRVPFDLTGDLRLLRRFALDPGQRGHGIDGVWCGIFRTLTPGATVFTIAPLTRGGRGGWSEAGARGYFVSTVGRDEETNPHLHQKSGDRGQAVGSVATEARVLIKSRLLYQNPS